jgi:SAM-dependent methyltransferase
MILRSLGQPLIMRGMFADKLQWLHRRMRQQKLDLFLSLAIDRGSLLDLGGGTGINREFLPLYRAFETVHTVNLHVPPNNVPPSTFVVADACLLPYNDNSFDWVFSNAVLEHIPPNKQRQFAKEVQRVARKGYLVATPDRTFPIDPHTLLPGIQFLPRAVRVSYARISLRRLTEPYENINLLSAHQLRDLFPEARILRMGFPVWPNNLVAVYTAN